MADSGNAADHERSEMRVEPATPRFLRSVKSTSIPQSLVFLDCQPFAVPHPLRNGELQYLRCGTAIAVRRRGGRWGSSIVCRFSDPLAFWAWLSTRVTARRPVWLFSHQMAADSTFLGVWERLDEGSLTLNRPCSKCGRFKKGKCADHSTFKGLAIISDPPVIIRLSSANGNLTFIDTNNYWRMSLAKLGKGFGYSPRPRPSPLSSPEEWSDYSLQNANIIKTAVTQTMDEWDREKCGRWGYTAAALGYSSFRTTLKHKEILINHGDPHTSLARSAYFGGQCEAYYIGEMTGEITLLDIRSLYPSVMQVKPFPVEFLKMGKRLDLPNVQQLLENYCAIAHVVIRTTGEGYPKRIAAEDSRGKQTVKTKLDGRVEWQESRLIFPTGEYATYLAGPELQYAIKNGDIIKILSIAWYRQGYIFGDFVQKWFNKRPKKRTPENYAADLLSKTVMNSLSGYFAKLAARWKSRAELRAMHRWGQWWSGNAQTGKTTKYRAIAGCTQELVESGESKDSVPEISAYITSYGRLEMRALRRLVPLRTVLYQDTDSLICLPDAIAELNNRGLIRDGELGFLKFEKSATYCNIRGVKDYTLGSERVASGLKEEHTEEPDGSFSQEQTESLPSIISRPPDGTLRSWKNFLQFRREFHARKPGPDGWTIAPHFAGEAEDVGF